MTMNLSDDGRKLPRKLPENETLKECKSFARELELACYEGDRKPQPAPLMTQQSADTALVCYSRTLRRDTVTGWQFVVVVGA
jgi:signal recognition particle subunit SEC65